MKKALKITIRIIGVLTILFFLLFDVSPPKKEIDSELLKETKLRITKINFKSTSKEPVLLGWWKENITPNQPIEMVGYGFREPFNSVTDSLFVRTMVFKVNNEITALISLDILIVPPYLADKIRNGLKDLGINHFYFSASHSHSSFGGFGSSGLDKHAFGGHNDTVIQRIVDKTYFSVKQSIAQSSRIIAQVYSESVISDCNNRLIDSTFSQNFRTITFKTDEGEGKLMSFNAHPTNIPNTSTSLSNDYPGVLCGEDRQFSMFMAGTMGSCSSIVEKENEKGVLNYGKMILKMPPFFSDSLLNSTYYFSDKIVLPTPDLQVPLQERLRLRGFVLKSLFGVFKNEIDVLRIGNTLLIGLPCELSAEYYPELESKAKQKNLNLIVTSFNGNYMGYATPSYRYKTHYMETREMNWTGKYGGDYFATIVKMIIEEQEKIN